MPKSSHVKVMPRRSVTTKEIIQNFTPAWFAAIMGTGVISALFWSFPYGHNTQPMKALALLFFFLNLLLFLLFTAITIARYYIYPHTWITMLRDPATSLYTSCFPMGGTTLINAAVNVVNDGYDFGGQSFLYFIWAMWWVDVIISVVCCWGLVHIMSTMQKHSLDAMTAMWLFPVVTLTVAASSGGVLALALQKYSPLHALISVTVSVFMVTIGLTLALMIITINLLRVIIYGLPRGPKALSMFLPLGPTAQSGYAALLIGQNFKSLLPYHHGMSEFLRSDTAGETLNVICICISFMLWSLASMCIISSLIGIQYVARQMRIPFSLSFWGLVFPNGVFANLTVGLSVTFDSAFLRIFGAIYAITTLLIWAIVASQTIMVVYNRTIFEVPTPQDNIRTAEPPQAQHQV